MGWPKASDWYASVAILKLIRLLAGSQLSSGKREVAELYLELGLYQSSKDILNTLKFIDIATRSSNKYGVGEVKAGLC